MLINCLAVGAGGFVGSVLRYLIGAIAPSSSFPWATFAINVVGSFVLAAIAAFVLRGLLPNEQLSLFLRVGLCGGFTTMSTFSLEAMGLVQSGSHLLAAAYVLATCALCIAAAFAGDYVVKSFA